MTPRTVEQLLETLDNLAESFQALGHPVQARVMRDALEELRRLISDADHKERHTEKPKKR